MQNIALAIESYLVVKRSGDRAIRFVWRNIGVNHKQTVTNRRLNGRIKVKTVEHILCYTRVQVDLKILRAHCIQQQQHEFGEIGGRQLANASKEMLPQQLGKALAL